MVTTRQRLKTLVDLEERKTSYTISFIMILLVYFLSKKLTDISGVGSILDGLMFRSGKAGAAAAATPQQQLQHEQ